MAQMLLDTTENGAVVMTPEMVMLRHGLLTDQLERQLPITITPIVRVGLILTLNGMMKAHLNNLEHLEEISILADESVGSW